MPARSGMSNLISRWRRLVDDAGSSTWTDDQAQQLLDMNRIDFWQEPLTVVPLESGGSVIYTVYQSEYMNLEEATSGTSAWRVYDSNGTVVGTATYSVDYIRGIITFTADQGGSARYLDGRSYDLNGAAADAWRERAASQANDYDFQADGARFSRGQWFDHCMSIADRYDMLRRPVKPTLEREDM